MSLRSGPGALAVRLHRELHSEPVEPSGQATAGQRIEFEVSDDGCGFDPGAVADKGGLGLTSIRERATGLGGALSLMSAPGQGTTLKVDVYLSDREITQ